MTVLFAAQQLAVHAYGRQCTWMYETAQANVARSGKALVTAAVRLDTCSLA